MKSRWLVMVALIASACASTSPQSSVLGPQKQLPTSSDIADLRKQLAENPEQLAIGVTRHLVTYATGMPAGALDQKAVEVIAKSAKAEDYGLRSLLHAMIQSDLFRMK